MDPDLDINQLHKVHDEREKQRRLVYETVYLRCRGKIIYTNNKLYHTECWYKIPKLVFGLPLFNVKGCICYLMLKLRKQLFNVKYYHENQLYISWARPTTHQQNDTYYNDYCIREFEMVKHPKALLGGTDAVSKNDTDPKNLLNLVDLDLYKPKVSTNCPLKTIPVTVKQTRSKTRSTTYNDKEGKILNINRPKKDISESALAELHQMVAQLHKSGQV